MHLVILTREIGHYHDARYRGAARRFGRVSVLSTANDGNFAEFLARDIGGYHVERLFPGREAYAAAVADGSLRAAMEGALDRLAPDAVAISGWSNPESMIAIRWARRRGLATVMMSESQGDDAARSPLREAVKRRIVGACDAALVGGPPHAAYITRLGIPAARVFEGYNAVDNAHFAQLAAAARSHEAEERQRHGLPARYLLASARFIAKKNLPALVRAYGDVVAAVAAPLPDLVILGDGEERAAIEQAVRDARVQGRVHLPGYRGYDVLPAFYGLAELFIHVSTVEQWGLVINEAMASGTPVLASSPCGAARTMLQHDVSGLVVKPTRAGIAGGLVHFFSLSPAERAAMAAAGVEAVSHYGPDRFGSGMLEAVTAARALPRRGPLATWDAAILARMEKTIVEQVA